MEERINNHYKWGKMAVSMNIHGSCFRHVFLSHPLYRLFFFKNRRATSGYGFRYFTTDGKIMSLAQEKNTKQSFFCSIDWKVKIKKNRVK